MSSTIDAVTAARTEALFASWLSTGTCPSRRETDEAIRATIRARGGVSGCLAEVATEYGDRPETAVARMCWARDLVADLYSGTRTGAAGEGGKQ